jgi:hypothetical protein
MATTRRLTHFWCLAFLFPMVATTIRGSDRSNTLADRLPLVFSCRPDNDLYVALTRAGARCQAQRTPSEAIGCTQPGQTVLILADEYPEQTTSLDSALFDLAAAKKLHLYIEYPDAIPGLQIDPPRATKWERVVVASNVFQPDFSKLRILGVSSCRFTPTTVDQPDLVIGRVAGVDKAVFGLPKKSYPILFQLPDRNIVVATTKLSNFVTGRYAPTSDWPKLWQRLLAMVNPTAEFPLLQPTPVATPAYGPDAPLPADIEHQTLSAAAKWYLDSHLLIHPDEEADNHKNLIDKAEFWPTPKPDAPIGDGSCGIREGFDAAIQPDGLQRQRSVIRADCNAESAMCLAFDWAIHQNARHRNIAENLLDYLFFSSNMQQDVRANPKHPAFGLIAWGDISPAWLVATYGDDQARVILATIAATACLESDRWDESICSALLANLRTTGQLGFRGNRIDIPHLERHGWKHYYDAKTVNIAPHYESALWACYLWAYRHTNYQPFLHKAKSAIRITMEAYPAGWRWKNNLERSRILLPLAWLVRIEDTPEHRKWLFQISDDLLSYQDASGAIATILGTTGSGHYLAPTSNEEYGTREIPLIQNNGDTISDQLYTTGFAILALREAIAATQNQSLVLAEKKLAEYLCRIQIRSEKIPSLNGGWFRAFDYSRWEYWASTGDIGWGAWCIEAGWGQAWTAATLALRIKGTSLWELTAESSIAEKMAAVQRQMAQNEGGPWNPNPQ